MSNKKLIYVKEDDQKIIKGIIEDFENSGLKISLSKLAVDSIITLFEHFDAKKIAHLCENDTDFKPIILKILSSKSCRTARK